jgi:hypothetical protein
MEDRWTELLDDGREVHFAIWPSKQPDSGAPQDPHLWQRTGNWHYAQGCIDDERTDAPMLFAGLPTRKVVQFNFWQRRAQRLR